MSLNASEPNPFSAAIRVRRAAAMMLGPSVEIAPAERQMRVTAGQIAETQALDAARALSRAAALRVRPGGPALHPLSPPSATLPPIL